MPRTSHFIPALQRDAQDHGGALRAAHRADRSALRGGAEARTSRWRRRATMPTDQILSSFPPANAEGAFGDRLPQIVLKRRTLPWERNPARLGEAPPRRPGWHWWWWPKAGDALHRHAGERLRHSRHLAARPGRQGRRARPPTSPSPDGGEDLSLQGGSAAARARARGRRQRHRALANGDDDGWLAVVLANRLPVFDAAAKKPVRYMACLVNVEGQLEALPSRCRRWRASSSRWRRTGRCSPRSTPRARRMHA